MFLHVRFLEILAEVCVQCVLKKISEAGEEEDKTNHLMRHNADMMLAEQNDIKLAPL